MAKNNSVLLDIGARMDKSWKNSLNNMGTDLKKVSHRISNNMNQYNKSSKAINRYTEEQKKLQNVLDKGNSTTATYAEKMRNLEVQNKNLASDSAKSKQHIDELNDTMRYEQKILDQMTSGKDPWKKFQDTTRLVEISNKFRDIAQRENIAKDGISAYTKSVEELNAKINSKDFSGFINTTKLEKAKTALAKYKIALDNIMLSGKNRKDFSTEGEAGFKAIEDAKKRQEALQAKLTRSKANLDGMTKGTPEFKATEQGIKSLKTELKKADKEVNKLTKSFLKLGIAAFKEGSVGATRYATKQADIKGKNTDIANIQGIEAQKAMLKELGAEERKLKTYEDELARAGKQNASQAIQELRVELAARREYAKQVFNSTNAITKSKTEIDRESESIKSNTQKIQHNKNEIEITSKKQEEYINNIKQQLVYYDNKIRESEQISETSLSNIGKSYGSYLGSMSFSALSKVTNAMIRLGKTAMKTVGRMAGIFSKTASQAIGLQKAVRLIVQYGFGFRSLYYLIRRMRTAIKDGFGYLGTASEEMKTLINTLKELVYYMKSAAAAMIQPFLPLINTIIPKLVALFNKLSTAIATFVATLTGQSKIYKATTDLNAYANALDDASDSANGLSKALGAYDKLNVISKDADSLSGLDTSDWFTEEAVTPSTLAEALKNAWENADFTEVANIIGTKLKESLEKLDWANIFNSIKNASTSIATLINGFINVDDLDNNIGTAIGNILNGINEFVYTWVTTLDWSKLGEFFSNIFTSIFQTVDWAKIGETTILFIQGVLTTLNSFLQSADWKEVGTSIGELFSKIDVQTIKDSLGNFASNVATAIKESLQAWAETDPDSFGVAAALAIGFSATKLFGDSSSFEAIKQGFTELLGPITSVFTVLGSVIGNIVNNGFLDTIGTALFVIVQNLNPIVLIITAIIGLLVAAYTTNEDFRKQVNEFIGNLLSLLKALWTDIIVPLIDLLKEILLPILAELWKSLGEVGVSVLSPVMDILNMAIGLLVNNVLPIVEQLLELAKALWQIVEPIILALIDILGDVLAVVIDVLGTIIKAVTPVAEFIATCLYSLVSIILSKVIPIVKKVADFVNEKITWLTTKLKTFLNWIIKGFNWVLTGVGKLVNGIVNALNKLHWNAPGWVTKLTGIESFGFNLPQVTVPQIPYLAQGAVIPPNKQFMAMLGDQKHGTNIEAPLDTIKQALAEVLQVQGNNEPIVLQLDGKTVAKVVWDESQKRYKQTGKYAY